MLENLHESTKTCFHVFSPFRAHLPHVDDRLHFRFPPSSSGVIMASGHLMPGQSFVCFILQCDTANTTRLRISPSKAQKAFNYSVKIVNPSRKSKYTIKKLDSTCHFESLDALKRQLTDSLKSFVEECGYIEPDTD